jgi:hypothetical protein
LIGVVSFGLFLLGRFSDLVALLRKYSYFFGKQKDSSPFWGCEVHFLRIIKDFSAFIRIFAP